MLPNIKILPGTSSKSAPKDSVYSCNQCKTTFYYGGTLKRHVRSIHESVKYSCDQCNYKASQSSSLQRHIISVHEKIQYSCYHCYHKASRLDNLNQYLKTVHKGIDVESPKDSAYSCNQCEKTFYDWPTLKRHVRFFICCVSRKRNFRKRS